MTKVLLVEDDNNLREIYEARLAAEGYEISTAKDGEDALAVAKQQKPDLIISDVMMPRISGFEMLDILRNTDGLKHTKIIMLTALGQAEDKTRADSLGADRYLVKSQVTLEDIVKAADELLNPEAYAGEEKEEAAQDASFSQPAAAPLATAAPQPSEATPAAAAPAQAAAVALTGDSGAQALAPSLTTPAAPPPSPAPIPVASDPDPASDPTAVVPEPVTPQLAPNLTVADPAASPTAASVPDPVVGVTTTEVVAMPVAETPVTEPPVSALSEPSSPAVVQMPQPPVDPELAAAVEVQTAAQEEATVEAQIEDFAAHVQSAQEVEPTPPPPVTPEAAQNEQLIDNAANELHNAEPSKDIKPVDLPGKRVIEPLGGSDKPDIAALAAQEEAKENGTTEVPPPAVTPPTPEVQPAAPVAAAPPTPQASPEPAAATPTPETPVIPVVEQNAPAPAAEPKPDNADQPAGPPPEGIFVPNQNGSANENAL